MPFNIPILLTWLRIVLIPLLIAVYYVPARGSGHRARPRGDADFRRRGVTDWLDGYLARRWNQTSAFGAFLDPVADKLMVAAALDHAGSTGPNSMPSSPIIIGREITISALREWMAQDWRAQERCRIDDRQDQDGCADGGHPMLLYHAPLMGFDIQIRQLADLRGAGADALVDGLLHAHGWPYLD
jgi:cardiolipin synthase